MTMNPAVSNRPLSRVKLMDAPSVPIVLPSDSVSRAAEGVSGGLRSASLHSGPSHNPARHPSDNGQLAGPSPCPCPGVDTPPDTPSAALSASAEEWLTARMIRQGGKVAVATGEEADGSGYRLAAGDLIWDHSDLLHYQVIVARVEPWGVSIVPENGTILTKKAENASIVPNNGTIPTPETDFQWVAVCREGSAATPLLKALVWGAWLSAAVLAGIFLPGGWAVLLILALLLFTAWIVLRPSQRSVRRMLRMAGE